MVRRADNEGDVIALYRDGMSVPDIAGLRGLTDKRIYAILKQHDVTLRPRRGVGNVLSAAQEAAIVVAYVGGTDAVRLAERYAVGSTTVYGALQRAGVARRTNREIFRKLSDPQEMEIVALYGQGLPASQIAGRYSIHSQSVYNILERHSVDRRSGSEASVVYLRDEHAFDAIETEDAAYWLGFLAADGNVSNGRLRIGLAARDVDHLRTFCRWLGSDRPIYAGVNNHG